MKNKSECNSNRKKKKEQIKVDYHKNHIIRVEPVFFYTGTGRMKKIGSVVVHPDPIFYDVICKNRLFQKAFQHPRSFSHYFETVDRQRENGRCLQHESTKDFQKSHLHLIFTLF